MKDLIQKIQDNEKLNADLDSNWGLIKITVVILLVVVIIYWFAAQIVGGTQKEVLGAGLQLMITVTLAFVLVDFTFHRTNEKRFINAFGDLVDEIITNTELLTDKEFEKQINDLQGKIQKKLQGGNQWVGFDKSSSFTNWSSNFGNFYLKYLPTTNYFYFINQGFFNAKISSELGKGSKSHIAGIFDTYSKINDNIQQCENILQHVEHLESVNFQQVYHWIRDSAFEDGDYKKFMRSSIGLIEQLNEKYPRIKKENKIAKLKEKLKDIFDDQQPIKTEGGKIENGLWNMTWKGWTGFELFRIAFGIGFVGFSVWFGLLLLSIEDLQWKTVFLGLGFTILGTGFTLISSAKTDRDMRELMEKLSGVLNDKGS